MRSLQTVTLAFAIAVNVVVGSPVNFEHSAYLVKDSHYVPKGWTNIGAAPSDYMINVQIGLAQHEVQELEKHLHEGM